VLTSVLEEELATWPGPAAVAVVGPEGVLGAAGRDAAYRWASVTKVLTGLTVVTEARAGVVDLDDEAGPEGATLRHLLAHASGLSVDEDRTLAPPGRRRIYSNRGIELAAQHLAHQAGRPFSVLLADTVLRPLHLDATWLDGSPAHGLVGPVSDLAVLAGELLEPRVLDAGAVAEVTTPTYPGLGGVLPGYGSQRPNDWGLGVELRGAKSPHWTAPGASPRTFGHFGQSGAFLWVDPDARLACVAAGSTPFGEWAVEAWPRLSARVLETVHPSRHGAPR
jgi:CubicO group peptidase (beta-lactamase class C family)